jgi:hypothetical protein
MGVIGNRTKYSQESGLKRNAIARGCQKSQVEWARQIKKTNSAKIEGLK